MRIVLTCCASAADRARDVSVNLSAARWKRLLGTPTHVEQPVKLRPRCSTLADVFNPHGTAERGPTQAPCDAKIRFLPSSLTSGASPARRSAAIVDQPRRVRWKRLFAPHSYHLMRD
jgi:hypothetical protein